MERSNFQSDEPTLGATNKAPRSGLLPVLATLATFIAFTIHAEAVRIAATPHPNPNPKSNCVLLRQLRIFCVRIYTFMN